MLARVLQDPAHLLLSLISRSMASAKYPSHDRDISAPKSLEMCKGGIYRDDVRVESIFQRVSVY